MTDHWHNEIVHDSNLKDRQALRLGADVRKHLHWLLILSTALLLTLVALPSFAQSPGPLQGKVFGSGNKALVVVLHGDLSKGGPAVYHYDLADRIARSNKGVTVLGLIRPGYQDNEGRKSKGSHSNRRDHYTKRNNTLVAQTIQNMAQQVGTNNIIAVGHSGGAAQIGAIAGVFPGLLDSAVLVSCPCDIRKWRSMNNRKAWTKSQSPMRTVGKIKGTRIVALTGTQDDNTRPVLAQEFVAAAKAQGLSAKFIPVNGAGHGFGRLAGPTAQAVKSEINR